MKAELFIVRSTGPEGQHVETLVARGDDGSFWMEIDYVELRPAEVEVLRQQEPGCIQVEPRSRKALVNMCAAMALLSRGTRGIELFLLASEYLGVVAEAEPSKSDLL